jgi:hypothetical protein
MQDRRVLAWRVALCGLLCVTLSACATRVDDYRDQKPALMLEQFFAGKLTAKGAVYDRSGTLLRRFTADIVGTWDGDRGRLDEVFLWSDGERQLRTWELTKSGADAFRGTATDVVGTAVGRGAGNAFNWKYKLRIDTGHSEIDVRMDDWMYLIDERTLLNRTAMSFFGFDVGEVVLVIEKVAP